MSHIPKKSRARRAAVATGQVLCVVLAVLAGVEVLFHTLSGGHPDPESRLWYGAGALAVGAIIAALRGGGRGGTAAGILWLLACGAGPAEAGTPRYHPHTFTISSASCPTGTPGYDTDGAEYGISLSNLRAATVVLCAASGQTITGAGTLHACVWVPPPWGPGLWVSAPEFDVDMTGKSSGTARCLELADIEVGVGLADRLFFYPSSDFGVSGGTTLATYPYGETR